LLFVCRYHLHSVAWFSYWINNLGFITESNTYCCCATSSSPLQGNTTQIQAISASRCKDIRCALTNPFMEPPTKYKETEKRVLKE
jgi:hypothetical protein